MSPSKKMFVLLVPAFCQRLKGPKITARLSSFCIIGQNKIKCIDCNFSVISVTYP